MLKLVIRTWISYIAYQDFGGGLQLQIDGACLLSAGSDLITTYLDCLVVMIIHT
jgi:hypothetical protein